MTILSLPIAAVVAAACLSSPTASGDPQPQVRGNSTFCFELYQQLRDRDGNLFFSPYSISTALAMTYGGARGETETEMAAVLHLSGEQAAVHGGFSHLQTQLNAVQEKGNVQLSIANALWAQQGYAFLDSFLELTKSHYGAGVRFVDFAGNTEAARVEINTWVEEQTREKIKDLIKQGMLEPATALVLCNAIYFKGNWFSQFEKERTRDADFFVAPEKTVQVSMMNQSTDVKFRRFDGFSAIELPYTGNALSMVVFLPEQQDGLAVFEDQLKQETVMAWLADLANTSPSEVSISLPKFKTTCEFELSSALAEMGMPRAFSDADFSGMTGRKDLFISKVVHKAFVDVNEEGTEAAAATAVIMDKASIRPLTFRGDHPFVFLIRDNATGSMLFAGRIVDPTV